MKKIIILSILLLLSFKAFAQENTAYNKELADSLGADEYGMKMYILVILKAGSNKTQDKKVLDSLFGGHMANIGRLAADGKLIVAGPMSENEKHYEGIFILNVKTLKEAKELLSTDPAVNANLLDPELYGWYGSAALPKFMPYHAMIQKTKM